MDAFIRAKKLFILGILAGCICSPVSALNFLFDGTPDPITITGNDDHVISISANGYQVQASTKTGEMFWDAFDFYQVPDGGTVNIGGGSVASQLGTQDFTLELELDPTSTAMSSGSGASAELIGFGVLLVFSDGMQDLTFTMGWSSPPGPFVVGNHPAAGIVETPNLGTLSGFTSPTDATGTSNILTLERQGTTLTVQSDVGDFDTDQAPFDPLPSENFAVTHIGIYVLHLTELNKIPATAGKFSRMEINTGQVPLLSVGNWSHYE